MNIKYFALILSMAVLPLAQKLHSQEKAGEPATDSKKNPAELVKLRESWQAARKRALEPVDRKYETALKKMLSDFSRAGDLDSALAVRAELEGFRKADAEIEKEPPKVLMIVKAVYGSDEQRAAGKGNDVTEKLKMLIKEGKISVKVHRDIFGDPNPYGPKTLAVQYLKAGSLEVLTKEVPANEQLTLP